MTTINDHIITDLMYNIIDKSLTVMRHTVKEKINVHGTKNIQQKIYPLIWNDIWYNTRRTLQTCNKKSS